MQVSFRCGPCVFYCSSCLYEWHSQSNVFRMADSVRNGRYAVLRQSSRNSAHCSCCVSLRIVCFDPLSWKTVWWMLDQGTHAPQSGSFPYVLLMKMVSCHCVIIIMAVCVFITSNSLCSGVEHNILLVCCQCEPTPLTMVRARLWPASPQHPRLAFSFDLLNWAEALLLECQVAVKDLCKALYFKCPHLVFKVSVQIHHGWLNCCELVVPTEEGHNKLIVVGCIWRV